jgi:two-component system, NtrC family, nitrogen regulation sensor histidine kinase NtrY
MSFRRRLLLLFALTVCLSVGVVVSVVSWMVKRAFDRATDERTASLVAQFRQEFTRRGEELQRRIQAVALTSQAAKMALAAAQASPNYNAFLDDAQFLAETQGLDFLEICDDRGTIISSAQWPAKFGYQEALAKANAPATPFLHEEETASGSRLGLFAIHTLATADHTLFLIGGVRLDRTFLSTLELPVGMRVMIYQNLDQGKPAFSDDRFIASGEGIQHGEQLSQLISSVLRDGHDASTIIHSGSGPDETAYASPLLGEDRRISGILLVDSSRQVYGELRNEIRSAALLAVSVGLLLAAVLSSWVAARVTKPVEALAHAANEVASGKWNTSVNVESSDEVGTLAASFNRMTRDLLDQQQRLLQAERVAAWREVARRLAHELKNPLFPLQLTVENLLRARQAGEQQFDETFRESSATLLSEIGNLKKIISRFSDFSKMPQPCFQRVQLNEVVANVGKLYEAQFQKLGITCRYELSASEPIAVDTDLLHQAISNLVLNAVEAMPQGGTLTLQARSDRGWARVAVSDTGPGLTPEQRDRLFTPYYTTKAHGTGLGLAIVQSIVSAQGGRVRVENEPGSGARFTIELPANVEKLTHAQRTHV